jgi:hypothetical protein
VRSGDSLLSWYHDVPRMIASRLNDASTLRAVVTIFVLTRIAFYAAAFIGAWMLPEAANPGAVDVGARSSIAMHWRWDAVYYYAIATHGYEPGGITAFFPLFPLLVRIVSFVLTGFEPSAGAPIQEAPAGTLVAGIMVAHLSAFVGLYLLYRLVHEETGDASTAQRTILYASLYPWAYHYSTPYTEGLFLATSVGAFLAMRHQRWLLAGGLIALASATRVVGIALVPVLAFELIRTWRNGKLQRPAWLRAASGMVLSPVGLLAYMLYLWWRVGDPLSFSTVQEDWGRERTFPLTTLIRGLNYAIHRDWTANPDVYARGVVHGFFLFSMLGITIWCARKWPRAWVLYGVLLFAIILSSPVRGSYTLHDTGRHVMVYFPVFVALARWGRIQTIHLLILMVFLPLFSLFTAFYVAWYPA